jgi:hypothetical protein
MPKPDVLLYDDVHRWTYSRAVSAESALIENSKEAEHILFQYRQQLRQSQRFYLDDDFVKKSTEASMDFDQVKKWANIARLPYRKMWIEFDGRAKIATCRDLGTLLHQCDPQEACLRIGMLCETLDEETGVWAMTEFYDLGDDDPNFPEPVAVGGNSYFFAPEGPSYKVLHPGPPWESKEGSWYGFGNEDHIKKLAHISLGFRLPDESLTVHPEFENRLTFMLSQMKREILRQHTIRTPRSEHPNLAIEVSNQTRIELEENAGNMRWLITILAMMNQVPTIKHYFPANGHRIKRGKSVPYLDHNVITLKLPKENYLAIINRRLNKAAADRRKNRAHLVRGHFRTMEHGKGIQCRHAPTLVENGVGYCLRCEQKIRWIAEAQRGDASLGWVNHDYVVEAN